MKTLDIDAVKAFALVADMRSFTRAAEASGTTQSGISLKLKRLEARLGRRLMERTPRSVRLTADGERFLGCALDLVAAHDRAVTLGTTPHARLSIGISDHVAGPDLAPLISRVAAFDPALVLSITVGLSNALTDAFDGGKFDAVIVRRAAGRRDGERILVDEFGWFAAPDFRRRAGEPLPLANLAAPCGVRAMALHALDRAGIAWTESFVGGGVSAVAAAVTSGIGIAALARRIAPLGAIDVGVTFNLPKLGRLTVALYARVNDSRTRAALRTLAAAFRSTAAA